MFEQCELLTQAAAKVNCNHRPPVTEAPSLSQKTLNNLLQTRTEVNEQQTAKTRERCCQQPIAALRSLIGTTAALQWNNNLLAQCSSAGDKPLQSQKDTRGMRQESQTETATDALAG